VRVLSATNRDLYREVQAGNFREDLFYRLNVINIQLPSLRDRREDIPLLAEHFVRELNEKSGQEKEVKEVPPEWIEALLTHQWPGNIRELQNEVRRCHALSGRVLDPAHLSARVGGHGKDATPGLTLDSVLETGSLKDALDNFEKKLIESALKRYRGNRARVCETLAIPKTTLYAKIRRYRLE
jgi:DNA-binding NtrC family response regulator